MEVKELVIAPFNSNKIVYNFKEVKDSVLSVIEKYQGLEFDEYGVKDAKKSKAELNKLIKSLNDRKILIKKECLKEYTTFENDIKELMSLIKEPLLLIDTQVKDFEEKRREERLIFVESLIESTLDTCELSIPVRDEWLNASFSNKKLKDEIEALIEQFKKDLSTIELQETNFKDEMKEIVINGGSINEALEEKTKQEMQYKRFQEKEELTKKLEDEELKLMREEAKEPIVSETPEKEVEFILKFNCSLEKADKLKQFIAINNITTERVK